MTRFALISGVPRAGKSSLSDAIVEREPAFTHIPLDRYVKPVPTSSTFLEWIATPACIAWDTLLEHIAILESGSPCYSPRPDWAGGWGTWISAGGAIHDGPGRRMEPARDGYLVPGTHAFAFPTPVGSAMRIFVETPEDVIAERLTHSQQQGQTARAIIREWLGDNPRLILDQAPLAAMVIDGTAPREQQVSRFLEGYRSYFGLTQIKDAE